MILILLFLAILFFFLLIQLGAGILGILFAVLVGFIAGAIARAIVPGTQSMEWWQTALLGLAGSFIFNTLMRALGLGGWGIVGSILGAALLLWLWGVARKKGLL